MTFKTILSIIFGEKVIQNVGKIEYENSEGDIENLHFGKALRLVVADSVGLIKNPIFMASPSFADWF